MYVWICAIDDVVWEMRFSVPRNPFWTMRYVSAAPRCTSPLQLQTDSKQGTTKKVLIPETSSHKFHSVALCPCFSLPTTAGTTNVTAACNVETRFLAEQNHRSLDRQFILISGDAQRITRAIHRRGCPSVQEDQISLASSSSSSAETIAASLRVHGRLRGGKGGRDAMPVPIVGRLHVLEYVALFFSFVFLLFERLLRIVTLALPTPIINFFYMKSRSLFNSFSSTRYTTVSSTKVEKDIVARVRDADGFIEICEIWNNGDWRIEEHIVQTGDGYLLGLHRLVKKSTAEERSRNRGKEGNGGKKVVYLHHGLLMNSEVWVCTLEREKCLPFILVEKGFDVWFGNNRGNKYSKKSIHHPSTSNKFWDFSMDEFAFHDIPDSIDYILSTTKQKSLSYIGFSQGTAQAFATLSIHPALNEKIDVFIALAPAMSPAGLYNPIVDALMKTSPNIMFLFFGRKSILSSTTFWQSILYPPIFVRVIDFFLTFLFNWRGTNISLNQKIAAYSKLYSYASVKTVVHWFQIIRNQSFQMYDDDIQSPVMAFSGKNFYKVAKFPTRNITTPIVLVYGGSDSLVDIDVMLKELPGHTVAKEIEHYEHLDFLWATDVDRLVFPHVLEALDSYSTHVPGGKERGRAMNLGDELVVDASSRRYLSTIASNSSLPSYSEDERNIVNDESGPPSRPSTSGSATVKFEEPQHSSDQDLVSPGRDNETRPRTPEGGNENQPPSAIKISRGNQKRSGSISSTFSTSSVGSAGMSPNGRNIIGPGGISLGMGRPVTAGLSTGVVIDEGAGGKKKRSVESNAAAKRKPSTS